MRTSSAKAKARRLQNLLTEELRKIFPNLPESDIRPALMGESGIDIKLSAEARKRIPFAFECKNVEKLNIWSAIKQGEVNAGAEGLTPAICFSRNRMPEPYVAVPLSIFMRMFYHDYVQTILDRAREGEKKMSEIARKLGVDEYK